MTTVVDKNFLQFIDVDVNGSIGNYTLPMPSDYKFEWKKTYVTEPTRNNSGAISVFPDKFFVPYFTVTWNIIKFEEYTKIMRYIRLDELKVRYYDPDNERYTISKFYIQQPTYNKLYTMEQNFNFVTNLQLIFVGTMNPVDDDINIRVSYNANATNVTGSISPYVGVSGDEIKINSGSALSREGYTFQTWNTNPDGSGEYYAPNSIIALSHNLSLYAQWEANE